MSRSWISRNLPRPFNHPFQLLHAKLYSLPKSSLYDRKKPDDFIGIVCEKIKGSLTSEFLAQKYADNITRGLTSPDDRHLICDPWFSLLSQSGSVVTSNFKVNFDLAQKTVNLTASTRWLSNLFGLKLSKTSQVQLKTQHDLGCFGACKSVEPIASGLSGPKAASASQGSNESSDLILPIFRMQKSVQDIAGDLVVENSSISSVDAAGRVALLSADKDPICSWLQSAKLDVWDVFNRKKFKEIIPIHLSRSKYNGGSEMSLPKATSTTGRKYIAIGSNIGDRVRNIELACDKMAGRGIVVTRTSALYETQPMYFEDQALFLNCVCEVETSLAPLQLLDDLKEIEAKFGRKETVRNGPREIDLDILLYDLTTFESDRLSIPHKKMMERNFVLRPLCDLIPEVRHPVHQLSFGAQLKVLEKTSTPLSPITPVFAPIPPLKSLEPNRLTNLMSIINMTPDSFSDGGVRYNEDPQEIIARLKTNLDMTRSAPIIDVGGQSTRPNAIQISEEEELSRILPIIKAIRSDPFFANVAISVDTYRASVASAAVRAGANIVNDISAGLLDPEMLPTIARLGCTCVLMHMRGNPQTMSSLTHYPWGIVQGVALELCERLKEAEMAGIRRWRICLDPGIGFAKTSEQNMELLRRFDELREVPFLRGFPWVVGVSRKGFIGKVTGVENAEQREFGTAVAVSAAIKGGADIVRVHDIEKMSQVVKMADAIWRSSSSRESELSVD